MPVFRDITGQRFNRWIAEEVAFWRDGRAYWRCQCDCGEVGFVRTTDLVRGTSHSCGCFKSEVTIARNLTHGHSYRGRHTRTYRIWLNMLTRCTNPNATHAWKNHGARGITVCDEWYSFENFLFDMGECPPGLTIERKDNDGGYDKDNCCWATYKEQANNKRYIKRVASEETKAKMSAASKERWSQADYKEKRLSQGHAAALKGWETRRTRRNDP